MVFGRQLPRTVKPLLSPKVAIKGETEVTVGVHEFQSGSGIESGGGTGPPVPSGVSVAKLPII